MGTPRFFSRPSSFTGLSLVFCLLFVPGGARAQRGGHGGHAGFAASGFRGGASFGGPRMSGSFGPRFSAPPQARMSRSPSFGPRPMAYAAAGPQAFRGSPGFARPPVFRPSPVSRRGSYRPAVRPSAVTAGTHSYRGSLRGTNRFSRPAPRGAGLTLRDSRGPAGSPRQGFHYFDQRGEHHPPRPRPRPHGFLNSSFLFNPFFNSYSVHPFFWALYPFYPACSPYYSGYWDSSAPSYANENLPAEENLAEAAPEEGAEPEAEEAEEAPPEAAPTEPPSVVVELANGRTKTFTWQGDKMIVTESPASGQSAPSKLPEDPPASLRQ